jgi:hypothetical protein
MEGVDEARLAIRTGGSNNAYAFTEAADDGDYMTVEDAKRIIIPLARQTEAMKHEMAELRDIRDRGREAAGTLHDALMVERAANAELRAMLERCAPAEQSKSWLPVQLWKQARALIGGGK